MQSREFIISKHLEIEEKGARVYHIGFLGYLVICPCGIPMAGGFVFFVRILGQVLV